jgi:hypothetical protein
LARSEFPVAPTRLHTAKPAQSVVLTNSVDARPSARTQLFSSFASAYFPLNTAGTAGADIWYHVITDLSILPNKGQLLEKALSAITCVALGQIYQDQRILYHGTHLYNAAVRHMSDMIRRQVPSEELLYATVIFQRLEVCSNLYVYVCGYLLIVQPLLSPVGVEPWLAHAQGTSTFLKRSFYEHPTNSLILSIHKHQQILGIVSPVSSKPSWYVLLIRSVFFAFQADPLDHSNTSDEGSKSSAQSDHDRPIRGPYDIFQSLKPALGRLKQLDGSSHEACQTLLQDLNLLKDKTIAWFTGFRPCLGPETTRLSNFQSSCAKLPTTDAAFGPAYIFPSLNSARLSVVYWTSLAIIYTMIFQTKMLTMAHTKGSKSIDLMSDEDSMHSWFYADEVCRGIPFCLTNTEHIWGSQYVMFSLAQAAEIYSKLRWREKFIWCQDAFTAIEHLGFGLAVCLRISTSKRWSLSENADGMPPSTPLIVS